MCWIIVTVLFVHWFGMHWIVHWFGGEENLAHGQSTTAASSTSTASSPVGTDDGWRRTAKGWEYLASQSDDPLGNPHTIATLPSVHLALSQIWPAAAAACMILLIAGLPDQKNETAGKSE